MSNFYCGHCMSNNVIEIETFEGEAVIPDDKYYDGNTGIVVKCKDCGDVTGFLIIVTGVVSEAGE